MLGKSKLYVLGTFHRQNPFPYTGNPFPPSSMSMLKEFRDFAMKGNVVDMAVGIIIGAAFGKIVSSLVNDMLMPAIGLLVGKVDFKTLAFEIGSTKIAYGMFIQSVVDFVIVAFCIFIIVKQMNCFKKPVPAAVPAEPPAEVKLLTEIRDALKSK